MKDDGFSLAGTLSVRSQETTNWDGIAEVILGRKEWFDRWMEGEKECKFCFFFVCDAIHSHANDHNAYSCSGAIQ